MGKLGLPLEPREFCRRQLRECSASPHPRYEYSGFVLPIQSEPELQMQLGLFQPLKKDEILFRRLRKTSKIEWQKNETKVSSLTKLFFSQKINLVFVANKQSLV